MSKISASRISARFVKSVSLLAVAASIAGCAQGTARFNDGFYTGAVPSQNVGPVQTPFPSNAPQQTYSQPQYSAPTYNQPTYQQPQYQPQYQAQQPVYAPTAPAVPTAGGVDRTYTGSVPRQSSVQRQPLTAPAPAAAAAPVAAPQPVPVAESVQKAAAPAPAAPKTTKEGWTAAGGTYITIREGETVYNLAKRYGVPANAILEANNLRSANSLTAGSRVIIPTYVYSRTAGVSAPDASAQVRAARSSIGGRSEFPVNLAPVPSKRPVETQVASLAPVAAAAAAPKIVDNAIKTGKYAVSAGDTLSGIARRTGTSVASIKRLNGLSGDSLRIGQSLLIPGIDGNPSAATPSNQVVDRTVTSAEPKVASYQPPKVEEPAPKGAISTIDKTSTASAPAATGVETMRWPVKGRVISSFGSNVGGKGNDGIDISVPRGTPIKSAENGVVIYAGDGLKEFGKTVLVRHGNGLVTVYGHLDSIKVSRGDNVKRGQQVGVSGMTGSAKQPQLHFEVRKNTSPVNPMTYLR